MCPHIQIRPISLFLVAILAAAGCEDSNTTTPVNNRNEQETVETNADEIDPVPDKLIASFTDHVQGYDQKQVPFEMILTPGDEAKGIKQFYIGKTEVSREMFLRWAYGGDLDDNSYNAYAYAKLIERDLRPSPIYSEHIALHVARGGQGDWLEYPALGMSWRTAQAYCLWLSEQTGKKYRLPTDGE